MTPVDLLRGAHRAGLVLGIAPSGNLLVQPAGRLSPELRELLTAHKPALLALLRDVEQTTTALIDLALRAADAWGEDPEGRAELLRDIADTPLHQRGDLLALFQQHYGWSQLLRNG